MGLGHVLLVCAMNNNNILLHIIGGSITLWFAEDVTITMTPVTPVKPSLANGVDKGDMKYTATVAWHSISYIKHSCI